MKGTTEKDVKAFFEGSPLFKNQTILLEKNENSGLIQKAKPCSTEFFEALFNRVFWGIYSELGFAAMPFGCGYTAFVGSELFFCRNTEERFLNNIGLEKKFSYSDGKIIETVPINLENLVFLIATPFELARNAAKLSIAALKVNSKLDAFEGHYKRSLLFWEKNRKPSDPVLVCEHALEGALQSMQYSILASLALSLKIHLRDLFPTKNNLLGGLITKASQAKSRQSLQEAGYFSINPYDISKPFLGEDDSIVELLRNVPTPQQPHYIWRENAKLCCSMHLAVLRSCFLGTGKSSGLGSDVFFLRPSELQLAIADSNTAAEVCALRKKMFEKNCSFSLPNRIAINNGKPLFEKEDNTGELSGLSVGAKNSATGKLVFVENAGAFGKVSSGDVVFSKNFSPELVVFYGKCSAVISQTGGALAHSAIVAREHGLPCVVQVKGADQLSEGSRVKVDGRTGKIFII